MIFPSDGPRRAWPGHRFLPGMLFVAALLAAALPAAAPLAAQPPLPDTAAPRRAIYNLGLDEFWIGGVLATKPPDGQPYSDVWNFLRDIGVKVIEMREHGPEDYWRVDSLAAHAAADEWLIPNIGGMLSRAGNGREAVFFPFDSAQSYYYRNVFASRSGGDTARNFTTMPGGVLEQVYDAATTAASQTVASGIAFGYIAGQKRWPVANDTALSTMDCSSFITNQIQGLESPMHYITVTGHMFSPQQGGGTADDGDTVLVVEVWCEIPAGTSFQDTSGAAQTAAGDTEYLFRAFSILKRSLAPPAGQLNFDVYHDTTIAVDMRAAPGTLRGGPYHANNSAHRFDIRVRWAGAEKVALRGVSLRDSIGWLMRGGEQPCIDHRQAVMNLARRFVNDSSATPVAARRAIMRLYTGDEGKMFEHGPYATIDSQLAATTFGGGNDTIRGIRAYRAQNLHSNAAQHTLDDEPELTVELYPGDVWYRRGQDYQQFYGLSDIQLPTIAEHNGGRWFLPLLVPARAEVERYERFLQRFHFGQYIIGPNNEYFYGARFANELGHAAWSSRRTGKRLTIWPSVMSPFNIQPVYNSNGVFDHADTTWTHILEAAEMRAIVNLGLVYGSRGVHYSWVGSDTQEVYTVDPALHPNDLVQRWFFYNDFGPVGPLTSMQENYRDTLVMRRKPENDNLGRPAARFPNFYTGWGNRLNEMRWLNKAWLPRIGAAMARLRWRDAYSMHFIVPQAYMADSIENYPQTRSRPLPATEMVRSIEAFDRFGNRDSAAGTYVELGLFDTLKGAQRIDDTMHLFLLNRRTFERSGDIAANSALGRTLDTLAEVRTLAVRLNIHHPDTLQYNFVRIQEIEPDTARLPFATAPRAGLDTIIREDSLFNLTLRPGGAALLRVTFCQPNQVAFTGDTRFNNGKKFLFDGVFWHAVYVRRAKFWAPPLKTDTVWADQVFYRRSLPITKATGAIRWDPRPGFEVMISDTNDPRYAYGNHFPSLAVRADSTKLSDRVATIVWTTYPWYAGGTARSVLVRNVRFPMNDPDAFPQLMTNTDSIGLASGTDDAQWGTPTVSRLHGAYAFAFSDDQRGIVAVIRQLDGNSSWWQMGGGAGNVKYRTCDTVQDPMGSFDVGQYPTMPPFAHITGRDSSIGIAWQQPTPYGTHIFYARLIDTVTGGAHRPLVKNRMMVSQSDAANHVHPSMDMTQDVWCGAQEGITWESFSNLVDLLKGVSYAETWVHHASLFTETSRSCDPDTSHPNRWRPYFDCIENAAQWSYEVTRAATVPGLIGAPVYPSESSINARTTRADDSLGRKVTFSVVMSPIPGFKPMQQSIVEYGTSFIWPQPQPYQIGGFNAHGAAAPVGQLGKHAVLFVEAPSDTSQGVIETSREYFARARPRGYQAHGRRVFFSLSDAAVTAFSGTLFDVWANGPDGAMPLPLVPRTAGNRRTDNLTAVRELFRSVNFAAHDSVTIGCELHGRFAGDTALAGGQGVTFITELVDSASDVAVARLDSFTVTAVADSYDVAIQRDFDLFSGTYYVRTRIETSVAPDTVSYRSLYPVEELSAPVDEEALAKMRLVDRGAGSLRVDALPNPSHGRTQVRFSVPSSEAFSLTVYDAGGRVVARPVDGAAAEAGRYALEVSTAGFAPGAYLVELRAGRSRAVARLVVVR